MTFQTFTGKEYLMIDIASNFGLDKDDWSDRIAWFKRNEHQLDALVMKAEEPALFFAGVQAWRDVQANKPIGYMISLDATASGLQILAALACDRKAAEICNVVSTGHRMDAYTVVYNEMCERLGDVAKIDRKETKMALMTHLYTSVAIPKEVFGEGNLLSTFYSTVADLIPGADELNKAFLNLWNPKALSHDWVLPDNFHVKVKVMDVITERAIFMNRTIDVIRRENRCMEEGRSIGANLVHSIDGFIVREMTRRCNYDKNQVEKVREALATGLGTRTDREQDKLLLVLWSHFKATGILSARVLDLIDNNNVGLINRSDVLDLIDSLPKKSFQILSIHDCFRCLPHYGNDLRKQYVNLLVLLAKGDLLSELVSQLIGRPIKAQKMDPDLWMDIQNTNYALS